jgi:hypothetical protein
MRSFIQGRLGGTEYNAWVHGTFRSELRGVDAVQPGRRSHGLIDEVNSARRLPFYVLSPGLGRRKLPEPSAFWV